MRVTFLGTSHGVPEPNRRCSCTMVETAGRVYFVDMGMSAIEELRNRGIAVESVKGIFITHMHGDHTDGLIPFVDIISWYFKETDPVIHLPDLAGVDAINHWLSVENVSRELRYKEVAEGVLFDDGVLKATAIRTRHCDRSYAYILEAEGKAVLFTGDLERPDVDFPEIARQRRLDLAVCEAAHFPATEYAPVLKACDVAKICINHYSPWNIPNMQQLAKDMGETPVITVSDGMEVTL